MWWSLTFVMSLSSECHDPAHLSSSLLWMLANESKKKKNMPASTPTAGAQYTSERNNNNRLGGRGPRGQMNAPIIRRTFSQKLIYYNQIDVRRVLCLLSNHHPISIYNKTIGSVSNLWLTPTNSPACSISLSLFYFLAHKYQTEILRLYSYSLYI